MTFTSAHVTVSADGFMAGSAQTLADPLGRRGEELHHWMFSDDRTEVDVRWLEDISRPRDAYVMGRNMFGPVRGTWESYGEEWRGWWGEDPPYHAPVFVLTHHAHDPIEMAGGTTFHFVTDGFDAALAQAHAVGAGDVLVAGGASTIRQALAAGELDELWLAIAPLVLGAGERIFDGTISPALEVVAAEHSPLATHVRYRVSR
jgi:dihydrofolate reductase